MSWRAIAFAFSFPVVLIFCGHAAVGGTVTTPVQTASIPMTTTDWGPGTGGMTNPLSFAQFNPSLGTLTGVEITFSTTIQNNYMLEFAATPTPTTLYVATTGTSNPGVLANAALVSQLTDGPTVTLLGPGGATTIFGGSETTLPVDVVSMTEPSGTYSSMVPVTSPYYIPPSNATISLSTTLSASDSASLFASFIGTGTIGLPVTADAHSSFYTSSGNGGGVVLTSADAIVTVQYEYTPFVPFVSPEPSGLLLLGLGAGLGMIAARRVARSGSMARGAGPRPRAFD